MRPVRELMSAGVLSVTHRCRCATHWSCSPPATSAARRCWKGGKVIGVLSISDILSFQASTPAVPSLVSVRSVSEEEPPEEPEEGDEAPAAYFEDFWADAGADALERMEQTGTPEWDPLAEHTVAEAMTRTVVAVSPQTSARAAARLMTRLAIHRVLVLDGGRLCGILTSMDLVRAAGAGRI